MLKFLTLLLANAALVGIGYGMEKLTETQNPGSQKNGQSYQRIKGYPKNSTGYQKSLRRGDWANWINTRQQEDDAGDVTYNINHFAKRDFGLTGKVEKNSKEMPMLSIEFQEHLQKGPQTIGNGENQYVNQLNNKTFLKRFQGLEELPNPVDFLALSKKIPLRYLKKLANVEWEDLSKRDLQKIQRSLKNVKSLIIRSDLSNLDLEDFQRLVNLCRFLPNLKKIDLGFVTQDTLERLQEMGNRLPKTFQSLIFTTEEAENPKDEITAFMSSYHLDRIQSLNLSMEDGSALQGIDLGKFPNVKTLDLQVSGKLDSEDLKNLKSSSVSTIIIYDNNADGSLKKPLDLNFLEKFPNVDYLSLCVRLNGSKDPSIFNFEALGALKKLNTLSFHEPIKVDQNLVDILCKLENLGCLSLTLDPDTSPENQKTIIQTFAPQLFKNLKKLSFLSIDLADAMDSSEDTDGNLENNGQAPQNNLMEDPDAEQNEDLLEEDMLSDGGSNHEDENLEDEDHDNNELNVSQKQRPTFTLNELKNLFGKSTSQKTLSSKITVQPQIGELTKKPYSGSPLVSVDRTLEFYPEGTSYNTGSVTFRPKK